MTKKGKVITELNVSIENLYDKFKVYPFNSEIEACPCCVSDSDKRELYSKPLRDLQEDNISRYAFKAMTTWGTVGNFKYYLPRIFELLTTTDFIVDTFVVLGKLEFGNWETWNAQEIEAIKCVLTDWWKNLVVHESYFNDEKFIEIYERIKDIDFMLDAWKIQFNDNSIRSLIDLIYYKLHDLKKGKDNFKKLGKEDKIKFINWVYDKKEILEEAFFYFDEKEPDLAGKISNSLYILERTEIAEGV